MAPEPETGGQGLISWTECMLGHSTQREVTAPCLSTFSPPTLLLLLLLVLVLLHWKAHLLHFPRGMEVERAQTPCSTKSTHTYTPHSHHKGSNSSRPHGMHYRARSLHSTSIVSTTYHNTFQHHKRIWTSTPHNTHTLTFFLFVKSPNWMGKGEGCSAVRRYTEEKLLHKTTEDRQKEV